MKRDTITIVLVSKNREPLTIELSVKEVILISVLLLSLIGAAVFSMVNFRNLKSSHYQLSSSAEQLKEEISQKEGKITELKSKLETQKGVILLIGEKNDTSQMQAGVYSKEIQIEELQISTAGDSLNLSFRLSRNSMEDRLISGYLLIIAEHESGDQSKFATYPEFQMSPGVPLNYRNGDPYSIRKFKLINTSMRLKDKPFNYNKLKFMVFDSEGRVLLFDNRVLAW